MASRWFFDIMSEENVVEAMIPRSPWLIVITGLLLILGCAESAAAQSHTYAIHTDTAETGASTWNPSFVVIDMDKLGSRSPLVFQVTNSSSEDFSFVIEHLGIHAPIPAFGEITVRTNIPPPVSTNIIATGTCERRHPRRRALDRMFQGGW